MKGVSMDANKNPLISVIVPVWNTEDTLEKCLNSILNQAYRDIEIIAVNDASPDKCQNILNDYVNRYSKIKVINHDVNRGLFQARLSGIKAASGDYVTFVDSDDYVSVDWYRLLVANAVEFDSDIVMGNLVSIDSNGNKYIYNSNISSNKLRKPLCGKDIFEWLITGTGLDFSRHVVWNKLYSKELFMKCMPYFEKMNEHLIMTEDISFSFVLYYFARKMTFSNHDCYFYYRSEKSSTKQSVNPQKIYKNVNDLIHSFSFVENFLKEQNIYEKYITYFNDWKMRYFRWWSNNIEVATQEENEFSREIKKTFLNFFSKSEFEKCVSQDSSFTDATTTWNDSLEKIKEQIISEDIKIISFDIFDTLIVRPFLNPADIYMFMQKDFEKLFNIDVSFYDIRKTAEKRARKLKALSGCTCNEVTLTEIYLEMSKYYSLPEDKCLKMRELENDFEVKYCYTRNTGKELYDMAVYCGKYVVLTSDMYLEEETVNKILKKNGYCNHQNLFLSSSLRKLKYNGELFKAVMNAYPDYLSDEIMHIGDNWNVDYEAAKKVGLKSYFFPKTSDILFNKLNGIYSGNSIGQAFYNVNSVIDLSIILKNPNVGTLYAVAANLVFDNPFVSINPASDYNRDPMFIGLFPLGMHLLGITKWMMNVLKEYKGATIHFMARDGYLPKMVYDLIKKYYPNAPESNYIALSRKSMIPESIQCPFDLYKIKGNTQFYTQTPRSIFKIYSCVLKDLDDDTINKFTEYGIDMDKKFANEEDFDYFIGKLTAFGFDEEKAKNNLAACRGYLSNEIKKGDITFDLGYSGKLQASICSALGFPVDAIFEHTNGYSANNLSSTYGFKIHQYYNFQPSMSGIVNEFIFSDYKPSCISYKMKNNKFSPVYEEKPVAYQEKYILDEMARGCLKYIETYYEIFSDRIEQFNFNPMETSLMYEKMLMSDKWFDINIFKYCSLEDEYYGGITKANMADHWYWQLNNKQIRILQTTDNTQAQNTQQNALFEQLYTDGLFVSLYKKINKKYPVGSKKRERIKKLARIFVK